MIRSLFAASLALAATAPAAAADEPPSAIRGLAACRAIADGPERLACYDREAGALVQSVEKKQTLVLDQQEVRRTKRSLFGFTLPRIGIFGGSKNGGPEEPEFTQIETTIASIRGLGYNKFRFTIEDGAVWETTEGANAYPKVGQKVFIKKAALGSYFIRFENARSVKGARVG